MADIQLTPEELLQQSTEMATLQSEYESLFGQVKNSLEGINGSWSPNLASNFSGKITSAQNSFASIINMFGNGAAAAKSSALRFGTPSSWLNKIIESGNHFWDDINTIANTEPEEIRASVFKYFNKDPQSVETAENIGKSLDGNLKDYQGVVQGFVELTLDRNALSNPVITELKNESSKQFEECMSSGDSMGAIQNAGKYLSAALVDGLYRPQRIQNHMTGIGVDTIAGTIGTAEKAVGAFNEYNKAISAQAVKDIPVLGKVSDVYSSLGLMDSEGNSTVLQAAQTGLKCVQGTLTGISSFLRVF